MELLSKQPQRTSSQRGPTYAPPVDIKTARLQELLVGTRRAPVRESQRQLFDAEATSRDGWDLRVWYAGDPKVLVLPCVAVVGTRRVSDAGAARARRLATELARAGLVVVSGLASGVDTHALSAALAARGRTAAVIGTPLDIVTPTANGPLQQQIYEQHLLVSQFAVGSHVNASNFPRRNRTMAALTDATVIVEASDTSGTLHQAVECMRLGRWLFITRSCADDSQVTWTRKFREYPNVVVMDSTRDIIDRIQ